MPERKRFLLTRKEGCGILKVTLARATLFLTISQLSKISYIGLACVGVLV